MTGILLDTDVCIDHLSGAHALPAPSGIAAYSVITRCELFAGRGGEEAALRRFLSAFAELAVNRAVAERAGRLRREVRIATPDALIAATALEHGLTLLTRNVGDFERVPGLEAESPS